MPIIFLFINWAFTNCAQPFLGTRKIIVASIAQLPSNTKIKSGINPFVQSPTNPFHPKSPHLILLHSRSLNHPPTPPRPSLEGHRIWRGEGHGPAKTKEWGWGVDWPQLIPSHPPTPVGGGGGGGQSACLMACWQLDRGLIDPSLIRPIPNPSSLPNPLFELS
jgi:hypothetical protein